MGGLPVRGAAAGSRARRPGAVARPPPVLLEEREVGASPDAHGRRRARILGGLRLSQPRRPMARAALPGRLTWQTVRNFRAWHPATPGARSLVCGVAQAD